MSQCQLVHEPQRRKKKNRELAPRLQSATPAQFIELLVTLRIRTYESGDARMRGFLQGCRSRGLKRRPLLQTSSPLKPENQLEDSLEVGTANGDTSDGPGVGHGIGYQPSHIEFISQEFGIHWGGRDQLVGAVSVSD